MAVVKPETYGYLYGLLQQQMLEGQLLGNNGPWKMILIWLLASSWHQLISYTSLNFKAVVKAETYS